MPASRAVEAGRAPRPAGGTPRPAAAGVRLRLAADLARNRYAYLMVLPVLAYYLLFHYLPMYGVVIAFKDFSPRLGILGSPWAGLRHFTDFVGSYHFWRVFRNTLAISFASLLFAFPAPILLALLLNEIRGRGYRRFIQTVTYMPHFISIVVVAGLIVAFVSSDGILTELVVLLGGRRRNLLQEAALFVPIYVASGIWQEAGWGTVIYLAALSHVDPQLHEAATIDGAGRFRRVLSVTLPGIAPTVVILLILRIGSLMSVGFEKIFLLYSPVTYETADVISTFVYRRGLLEMSWSFSTAVGLFNSAINMALLALANRLSARLNGESLW